MNAEVLLVVAIIAMVVLSAVVGKTGRRKRRTTDDVYGYRLRRALLSPAERSFYGVLSSAVDPGVCIMAKVRVADVVSPTKGLDRSRWQKAFNAISSKHFDYVLCDERTLKVVAAIELNDKSHARRDRRDRDLLLQRVCESAGLPLLMFSASHSYRLAEVRERLVSFSGSPQVAS